MEARAADDTLYHYTSFDRAVSILQGNEFKLTPSIGRDTEQKLQSGRRVFFMSTTRNKLGGYSLVQTDGVIFNLDGNNLSNKYKIVPVAFFRQRDRVGNAELDESEDRVMSYESTIPEATSYIKSIHVMVNTVPLEVEAKTTFTRHLRKILLYSKQYNIPIFWYNNYKNFLLQKNSVDITVSMLKTNEQPVWKKDMGHSEPSPQIKAISELLSKPTSQKLSTEASKLLSSIDASKARLRSFGRVQVETEFIRVYRSSVHTNQVKIINRYMRRNRIDTFTELVKSIEIKWDGYYD